MANLFDLLHLADGESGAAAVSVLVAKTKHEEAEAATRLPASRAVDEANDRRREADQGKKAPGPTKLCFIAVNAKAQEKKNLVDEQIKLVKEQRKLLEEQISLLDKQRKMSEEQGEDVDEQQAARTRLMDEQIKLKEGQRRLKEEQIKLWEGRNRLSEELGEYDVKGRAKEFSQEQKKFKEDLAKYLEEEKNFWGEQRRMGRWYADYRRGISGSGNGYYANGNGNDHQDDYNGNNGSGGYGRGNRNGHRYSYGQDLSYGPYQQELYGHGEFNYDERQRHNYSGERQGHRGGKARRQNWQRKDRPVSDAAERSNTEEQQAVSASSETTEQKADAVDGRQQAVPASGSEISTGDGKGFAWAKRNGSQKRKMKRNSGNETDRAKRDSTPTVVDVWKKQTAATEPKTSSFEEEKKVTLDEYEKVREERKKSLAATAAAARRMISAEEFEGLQLLDKKKDDEDKGEDVKMADKVKRKEKAEKVQMGGTSKEAMPDPKKVADALFKHAPRPRRQYDQDDHRYNMRYDGGGFQGARGDNSGRGDGAPAPRGGYSSGGRGGYSRRGRGGYQQQGGRGNGRFQVQQRDQLNAADFPALPGTAPASAPPPSC